MPVLYHPLQACKTRRYSHHGVGLILPERGTFLILFSEKSALLKKFLLLIRKNHFFLQNCIMYFLFLKGILIILRFKTRVVPKFFLIFYNHLTLAPCAFWARTGNLRPHSATEFHSLQPLIYSVLAITRSRTKQIQLNSSKQKTTYCSHTTIVTMIKLWYIWI